MVEVAVEGQGLERPWRATEQFTILPAVTDDPKAAEVSAVLNKVAAEYYFAAQSRWIAARGFAPDSRP